MGSNAVFFGWNRALPGREGMSAKHFDDFQQYLGGLKKKGTIESFETIFLEPHGGDMNGFFLIRGTSGNLDGMIASEEWAVHMVRADLHLEGSGAIRAHTGDAVMERFAIWKQHLPE